MQLIGSCSGQLADQPDTMKRWAGSDQAMVGSNIASWSTKFSA
jgi:hypothetical protein